MKRACIMRAIRALICFAPAIWAGARGYIDSPGGTLVRSVSTVFFASRVDNSRLTTQVRLTLDRRPDGSRSLSYILDPRRINDHVVSGEPVVVVGKIVIDPIAVVVDVGLCELHAGKRYARGRLSQPDVAVIP